MRKHLFKMKERRAGQTLRCTTFVTHDEIELDSDETGSMLARLTVNDANISFISEPRAAMQSKWKKNLNKKSQEKSEFESIYQLWRSSVHSLQSESDDLIAR